MIIFFEIIPFFTIIITMKLILNTLIIFIFFLGCSKEPKPITLDDINTTSACVMFECLPKTYLIKSDFNLLPDWDEENYDEALNNFKSSCVSRQTKKLYPSLCTKVDNVNNSKDFFMSKFTPYEINTEGGDKIGMLTGYYEPFLRGSLTKDAKYKYPVYNSPRDLITVDLSSIYPDLKNFRLRGKLVGNKLIPYHTRKESSQIDIDADVVCYVDSKIDLFFLEVQGSGRILLDNNETIFIGYSNQNGHKYKSIGRYLVSKGEIPLEDISLQSIRAWFVKNPSRVDEVLNHNKSVVYFKQNTQAAIGSLGLTLTPKRSIAVDKRFIPLGSMLYCNAEQNETKFSQIVQAQDTGGAIKGTIRADMFLGFGNDAREIAGRLKAPLKLWILLPKNIK